MNIKWFIAFYWILSFTLSNLLVYNVKCYLINDEHSLDTRENDFEQIFNFNKRSNFSASLMDIQQEFDIEMTNQLNESDFKLSKLLTVEDMEPNVNLTNYMTNPLLFEGDMVIDPLDRNAIRNRRALWPRGRIPYVLSNNYSNRSRAVIARAIQEYHDKTCIRFTPKTSFDFNYLYIQPNTGCYSNVGLTGGQQIVSIGRGCETVGVVVHELMHACGFFHEQSRTDRDQHVRIIWENIAPRMTFNFEKYDTNRIQNLNERYDYSSIMHYGSRDFSKNGEQTIVPIRSGVAIGQRIGLSKTDVSKLNKLYSCQTN